MRNRINLLGFNDIKEFVRICSSIDGNISLYCPMNGYKVSAKSLLGVLASMEWSEVWIESDVDCYSALEQFIVIGEDNVTVHN